MIYQKTDGGTYGVYVVLPEGMTADLGTLQSNADTFVKAASTGNQATNFTSMTVYDLGMSTYNRHVYYFRPNDGANIISVKTNLKINVTTAKQDAGVPTTFNINGSSPSDFAQNAILFAGIGNFTSDGAYPSQTAALLGISNAPDANLVSIGLGSIMNRTVQYKTATISDVYRIVDDKGNLIKTITKTGNVGDTYSRVGLVDTLKSLGLVPDTGNSQDPIWKYKQAGMTISSGSLTDGNLSYLPGDLDFYASDGSFTTASYNKNLNADGSLKGTTYTVTVPTYDAAGKVTVQYVYQKKDASGNISYVSMANLPSTFPTEATYTSGQFIGNNQQYQISLPADPDGYKFAKTNNGGLTGTLTSSAQTIQVVYDQLASQVTANYYAVDKNGNPYYVYDGTNYTTDKDLALSHGGSLYLLGSNPYNGLTGDTVTINAPTQNKLEGAGQQKIDYYNFYGASGLDGKLQTNVNQLTVTYPADGGTVNFYYVKKFPVNTTYHNVSGDVEYSDDSITYSDGDKVSFPTPVDIPGFTIDYNKSTMTLIDSVSPSGPISIHDVIASLVNNSDITDEQITDNLSLLNGLFPVIKAGNQISALNVSYVYKTNAQVNLTGSQTITYGSSNDIDPTKFTVSLSNDKTYTLQNGDLKLVEDPVKNIGTYHVVLTDAGLDHINALDPDKNYEWIYDTKGNTTNLGTFIIKQALATYTLTGTDSKIYNGQTTKIDDVLGSYTVTLSSGDTFTLRTGDLKFDRDATNVGKYVVSLTDAAIDRINSINGNYVFSAGANITGSYNITQAAGTVTVNGGQKTYDGKAIDYVPTLTVGTGENQVELGAGNYTIQDADGHAATANAGDYQIVLTAAGEKKIQDANPNYQFDFSKVAGTAYKINKAQATITVTGGDFVYDGSTQTPTATVDGTVNGESLDYTLSAGEKNVGNYDVTATPSTSAAVNQNYDITVKDGQLNITQAAGTVTVNGGQKTYDGKAIDYVPTLTVGTGENQVELGAGDYTIKDANGNVATVNAGDYQIVLTAAGEKKIQDANPNYQFDFSKVAGAAYKISKAQATITVTGGDFVYDGSTQTPTATVDGTVNGESLDYTLSAGEKNVGNYDVTATPSTSATVNQNYDITVKDGQLNITQGRATYTLSGSDHKVYDGQITNIDDVLDSYSITLNNGETYQLQDGDLEFDGSAQNVGVYTVKLTASGLKHLQMLNPNYDLVNKGQNPTFNIEKKKVTITVGNATKQVGAKDPNFNANVVGLVSGDKLAYDLTREPGEKSGQYVINVTLGANDNYDVQVVSGKLTIKEAPKRLIGTVTVHYVAGGRLIHSDNHLKGIVGDGYNVKALSIPGYTIKRAVGKTNGKFDRSSKDITFYYTVDYTGVPQTSNGKPIAGVKPIKGTGEPGSPINAPEIPGYQVIGQAVIPNQPGQVALVYKAIEKNGNNGSGSHSTQEPTVKSEVTKPITAINNSEKSVTESTVAPLETNSTTKRLPQTGDKAQEESELFGLGIMALLGALGLVILKKRRSDD